jgi:predicted amidohydrolase YtcJ
MAECRLGTLEPGKEADLAVLAQDASLAALNNFPFTVQTRCTILGQRHVR